MLQQLMQNAATLRKTLQRGATLNADQLGELITYWSPYRAQIRPADKDEGLPLIDANGHDRDLVVPRWLCHWLGLRHRCVHLLLHWQAPSLGDTLVLQVRAWHKDDSPGQLDISVGGHVTAQATNPTGAALQEMADELGIVAADLVNGQLRQVGSYDFYEENPATLLYNAEWRDVFEATITTFDRLHFADQEVGGVYLCPVAGVEALLQQPYLPLASALRHSLAYCMG